jgi:AraC-like DNA-binding protein
MHFQIVQPNAFLRKYIKHYCFMETDANEGNIAERVIPTENVQLMFHYRNPFVLVQGETIAKHQPRTIISGLSNSYSDVSTFGQAGVVFVQFLPAGACHFFKFPLSEIENQSFDLSDIFCAEIKQIEEQLFESKEIHEKVSIIESFLIGKFSPIPQYNHLFIEKGIQLIKQSRGQITANNLAEKLITTPKNMERKFSNHLGKTPKQYIKLVRFQETLNDFSTHKNIHLTEYAYRNGYFDQAHFIRDFKSFSGYTPKEFVEKYPDFSVEP